MLLSDEIIWVYIVAMSFITTKNMKWTCIFFGNISSIFGFVLTPCYVYFVYFFLGMHIINLVIHH